MGLQIGLAALANVLTSSSMAVFNAWIFRAGYHFQFSLIVVQQIVCTLFALAQVTYLPGEKQKLRISGRRYFTMLLPFSAIVAAKLYIQNKAFEYVSPAFYAMIASTLPVGVTALAIVRKIEPFRVSTVVAAALVSVGGVMIKAGEVRLSGVGFVLTASALFAGRRAPRIDAVLGAAAAALGDGGHAALLAAAVPHRGVRRGAV